MTGTGAYLLSIIKKQSVATIALEQPNASSDCKCPGSHQPFNPAWKKPWGHWLWFSFMLLTWRRLSRDFRNTHQRSPTLLSSLTSISQASCLGESPHLLRLTANACKGNITKATAVPTFIILIFQQDILIFRSLVRIYSRIVSQAHDTIYRISVISCYPKTFHCRCVATLPGKIPEFETAIATDSN